MTGVLVVTRSVGFKSKATATLLNSNPEIDLLLASAASEIAYDQSFRCVQALIIDVDTTGASEIDAIISATNAYGGHKTIIVTGCFEDKTTLHNLICLGSVNCVSSCDLWRCYLSIHRFWTALMPNFVSVSLAQSLIKKLITETRLEASRVGERATESLGHDSRSTVPCDPELQLTKRECHLLSLGATGMQSRQIAQATHLSLHTVNTHFKNIYRKLGVKRRGEAIGLARALGQLS